MKLRAWVAAGAAAVVAGGAIAALEVSQAPGAPAQAAAQRLGAAKRHLPVARHVRPRAFASCAGLVRYARAHFAVTHGLPDPSLRPVVEPPLGAPTAQSSPTAAPPPATAAPTQGNTNATGTPSYSTTNVQEAGVDEPDIVKTDGSTIFTVSRGRLFAVGAGAGPGGPQLEGTLDLGQRGYNAQLLLRGSRLIVILAGSPVVPLAAGAPAAPAGAGARPAAAALIPPSPPNIPGWAGSYYYRATTTVEEVDVSDPAAMHVTRTMSVDGTFVDARQNGSTARLVIASAPPAIANSRLAARASGWIPRRQFHSLLTGRRYSRPAASCAAIARPAQFSGLGMLTILTLNLDRGLWTAGSDALMADAQVVYGSTKSLYVATQKWIPPQTAPDRIPADATVIDRFDVSDPSQTTLVASGEVPGYLLNQFSLSEYKGFLRVASTSRPIWWTPATPPTQSQSYVTVLATQGGALVPVGQVAGLGVGQQIYSVRFVDDAGYVVTFRRVDPLYTLDLSTPTAPKVAGKLELEGYSSYLHPVGNGLLLGVGQSIGTSANEPSGAQLELFDVSDPAAPKLLARAALGNGSSTNVSYDHHAFLFWPPTKLAVLPLQIYSPPTCSYPPAGPPQPGAPNSTPGATNVAPCSSGPQNQGFIGAIGYSVDRSGITEVGRVTHDALNGNTPAIMRSVVIGDRLFTISDAGVMASQLGTLARQAFVAFPQPQPQPQPGASGTGTAPPAGTTTTKPAGR
jgi:Beta propeller domain